MKRPLFLLLSLALVSCGGAEPAADATADATETVASETSTADGFVDNVTRAQKKASEISAEEGKRVQEVDDAMKDQ